MIAHTCDLALLCLLFLSAVGVVHAQNLDGLTERIRSGDVEQKREALFEIRNLRSEQASRIAIRALNDQADMVRATAASSIIYLPKDEAAGLLLPLLGDKPEFVRREAAYALGKTGSPKATNSLHNTLQKDKVLEVRNAAAIALGEIGDPASLNTLTAILQKKPDDDNEFLRRSAARSIGQIAQFIQTGRTKALTPQNFLPDKFKEIEAPKYTNLTEQFPAFRSALVELTNVLQNSSEAADTRREAAFALGAIGDEPAISILNNNLNSNDPYLSEISKESLLKMNKKP